MDVTFHVTHCNEIHCQYLETKICYSADSFEAPYNSARCNHPDVSADVRIPSLGCSDDIPYDDYCKIPEWCPRLIKQKENKKRIMNDLKKAKEDWDEKVL